MTATKLPTERDIPTAARAERRARLLAAIDVTPRTSRRATWPHRRLRLQLGAAGAASAATAATVVLLTSGGATAPQAADAEILRHVASALAPSSGTVLHARALVSAAGMAPQRYELWAQGAAPQAYRVIKVGHEGSWDGSEFSSYDAATNTISVSSPEGGQAGRSHTPDDYEAELRALVRSGQATVAGTSTIHGVPAYKLTVHGESGGLVPGSTAYVAQSSYRPLVIDYNARGGETVTYEAFEYLPATAANLRLVSLSAQHPGARVLQPATSAR
jgi:hypothetical protein